MAANLITYADGVVSPFLDGIMQELYTSGGGVITGGTITISGASTLHITQAHGALCGREFSIDEGDYSVPLSSSGTKLGRIYLHMDLANTAAPLEVLIETGASLTPVVQDDDVNETDGTYEINLATFEVDESTIKNLSIVAPSLKTLLGKTLQTINDCVLSTDPQDIAGAAVVSELNSKIAHTDYVSVTVTSGQTYRQVLNALYALADTTKINANSYVTQTISGGYVLFFKIVTLSSSQYNFMWNTNSTYALSRRIVLETSNSIFSEASGGSATTDKSTTSATVGDAFELHY